jgi:hypothetical protein
MHRKRPELCPHNWIIHYDNAPAYRALSVKQFLAQKSITEREHPPYYPDLALTSGCSKNKVCPKGTKISGYWRHPKNVTTALKNIPQKVFQKCFQQWSRGVLQRWPLIPGTSKPHLVFVMRRGKGEAFGNLGKPVMWLEFSFKESNFLPYHSLHNCSWIHSVS